MRRLTGCVAAGLVLAAAPLTACGGDEDPEPTEAAPQAGVTTTTAAPFTHVNPQAALLTLEDLPAGYAVVPPGSADEDTPFGGCPELASLDESAADDERSAEVAFAGGEAGPLVFHAVGDQDEGTAAQEFENFRAAVRKPECRTFQETDDRGQSATWTVELTSSARVGDDTLAFRISGDEAALYMTFEFALERIGDNVSMVGTARVPLGGAPPPDLSALLQRAHQKLTGAAP